MTREQLADAIERAETLADETHQAIERARRAMHNAERLVAMSRDTCRTAKALCSRHLRPR